MSDQPGRDRGRWVVLLLDGDPAPRPAVHAAWVIDGTRELADQFARFVTQDIDPAVVVTALDPVAELLTAREALREDAVAGLVPVPGPASRADPGLPLLTVSDRSMPALTAPPVVGEAVTMGGQRYRCADVASPSTGVYEYTLVPEPEPVFLPSPAEGITGMQWDNLGSAGSP